MKHEPNGMEIILSGIVIVFSLVVACLMTDTFILHNYPFYIRCMLAPFLFLLILKGAEGFVNIFYVRWQKKHGRLSK